MNLILLKDLPDCPKGTVFKLNFNGGYYSLYNQEVDPMILSYVFTQRAVDRNPGWFIKESEFHQLIIDGECSILDSEAFQVLRSLSNISGRTMDSLIEELGKRMIGDGLQPVDMAGAMYGECLLTSKGVGS